MMEVAIILMETPCLHASTEPMRPTKNATIVRFLNLTGVYKLSGWQFYANWIQRLIGFFDNRLCANQSNRRLLCFESFEDRVLLACNRLVDSPIVNPHESCSDAELAYLETNMFHWENGNLVFVSSEKELDNQFELRLEENQIVIQDTMQLMNAVHNSETSLTLKHYSVPISSVPGKLIIYGDLGTDVLTIDFANGNPIPPGGLEFIGGENDGDNDELRLIGYRLDKADSIADVTVIHNGPESGSIELYGLGSIAFSEIEPLTLGGTAADLTIMLPNTAFNATLGDDGVEQDTNGNTPNMSALYGGTAFEFTEFINPTHSLSILSAVSTNLTILDLRVSGFDATLNTGVEENRFGSVQFLGPIDLAADHSINVFAKSIFSSASSISLENGNISLQAKSSRPNDGRPATTIDISGTAISSLNGNISILGDGLNVEARTHGVHIRDSSIISTRNGSITITGIGGRETFGVVNGIIIANGSTVSATDLGTVTIQGSTSKIGGPLQQGSLIGVVIAGQLSVHNGDLQINGTGGESSIQTGSGRNIGVSMNSTSKLTSTGTGRLVIQGNGGIARGYNYGVEVDGQIRSNTAAIEISGTTKTGSGQDNEDRVIFIRGTVENLGVGHIRLTGVGLDRGINSDAVSITGTVSTNEGDLFIDGRAAGGSGFRLSGGLIQSTAGNINIVGQVNTTKSSRAEHGVAVESGGQILALGNGTVNISGEVNAASIITSNSLQAGVLVTGESNCAASTIASVDGKIDIRGAYVGFPEVETRSIAATSEGRIEAQGLGALELNGIDVLVRGADSRIAANEGSIEVNAKLYANNNAQINAGGDLSIRGSEIDVNSGSTIALSPRSQRVSLTAMSIKMSSPLVATNDIVQIVPMMSNSDIDLGGTTPSPQTLTLSDAFLDGIMAFRIEIGGPDTNRIFVSQPITRAQLTNMQLTSIRSIAFDSFSIDTAGGALKLSSGIGGLSTDGISFATHGTDVHVGDSTQTGLSFASGTKLNFRINGKISDTQFDQLNVVGLVDLSGAELYVTGSYAPDNSDTFMLVQNDGVDPIVGTFTNLGEGAVVMWNGFQKKITYAGGDGNDVVLVTDSAIRTISLSNDLIDENQAIGTEIGIVLLNGISPGTGFVVSLVSGQGDMNNSEFSIDEYTIRSARIFEFEDSQVKSIRLRVTEPSGFWGEAIFQIRIGNLSDHIWIGDITLAEGNSGLTNAIFTVTLSDINRDAIVIDYTTVADSALAGSDFIATSGSFTFQPGETIKLISIPILSDFVVESDESFFVVLSNARYATLADAIGVGTILNDDAAGFDVLPISGPGNVRETGLKSQVQFRLTSQPTSDVVVHVENSNPNEIAVNQTSLQFGANNWSQYQMVEFTGLPDMLDDGDQSVTIRLIVDTTMTPLEYIGRSVQWTLLNRDEPVDHFSIEWVSGNYEIRDSISRRLLASHLASGSIPLRIQTGGLSDTITFANMPAGARTIELLMGDGNDVLEIDRILPSSVEGQQGIDTLKFVGTDAEFSFANLQDNVLRNLEVIDMSMVPGISVIGLDYVDLIRQFPSDGSVEVRLADRTIAQYGTRWTVGVPIWVDGQVQHELLHAAFQLHVVNYQIYTNPLNRLDVDRSGFVTPLDALALINDINLVGSRVLEKPTNSGDLFEVYLDTDSDGYLSPLDVLSVVNYLNRVGPATFTHHAQ